VTEVRDHHATILLAGAAVERIEAVRRRWDPVMAAQIEAHVTLVYPREAPDVGLLLERLADACAGTRPFALRLGELGCFGRPEGGVYVGVEDPDGACGRLRAAVLRSPFQSVSFPLHVTLVHPRTSPRGRELWERGEPLAFAGEFAVDQVAVTAFDGAAWRAVARFALMGG
jgi:2'-5' RNA ligase